jgi:hypothetical protein
MSQIKYAVVDNLIDKHNRWAAEPWIKRGAKRFDSIQAVPDDYILLAIHFAPWWSPLKEWIDKGNKWLEIDYGYWGHNLPRRITRRVSYCDSHNLKLHQAPYSRLHTLQPAVEEWKTSRGDYIIVIEPQPETLFERTGIHLTKWKLDIDQKIKKFWQGDILWRKKRGGKDALRWPEYLKQLEGCYGVVGERTMACAEAAMLGYQSYTTDLTIVSLLMGSDITSLQTLKTPDRETWLNHIAWSQFSRDEFAMSTEVADMVERYQILQSF